jgi:hypothetical protein
MSNNENGNAVVVMGVATTLGVEMDEFGRSEAERTIVLDSTQAEQIDHEVQAGEHQTYQDALEYVIQRGLAEIKRTRDAAEKAKVGKTKAKAMDKLSELLSLNPTLVNQPEAMQKVFAQLGIKL